MKIMSLNLKVLLFGLLAVLAQGAINPFEYQKTASVCALVTRVDFKSTEVGDHTQLRYEVIVDEIVWDDSGLEPGDKLIIKYSLFAREKPGFWEKLFNRRPMPGPQELYEPQLSFFENNQAVLFLEKVSVDGETFYTPAANQYSSDPPNSAEYLKEYAAEHK